MLRCVCLVLATDRRILVWPELARFVELVDSLYSWPRSGPKPSLVSLAVAPKDYPKEQDRSMVQCNQRGYFIKKAHGVIIHARY